MKRKFTGVELLRLLAMLMIVIYHVVMWNDLDNNVWLTGWSVLGGLGVNIFGMISGFVSYSLEEKPFQPKKYLRIWMCAVCYSVGITLLGKLITPQSVTGRELILSLFPVTSASWWYLSSYTALFFLQPLLLTLVRNWQVVRWQILMYVALFSVYATVAGLVFDPLNLGWGFSSLWLCMLYVVGALIRKYDLPSRLKPAAVLWVTLACAVLLMIGTPLTAMVSEAILGRRIMAKLLTDYTSVVMLLFSGALVVLIANRNIKGAAGKLIIALAPASFGVYIIHCHPYIKANCITDTFLQLQDYGTLGCMATAVAVSILIWLLCLLVESMRMFIFNSITRVFKRKKEKEEIS